MALSPQELAEILNASRALQAEINTEIPGEVVSYDPVTRYADVKLCVDRVTADGRVCAAPIIYGVKVEFYSAFGADAIISFPIAPGDTGMLAFTQRSIDEFLIGSSVPLETRLHDINDCTFRPTLQNDLKTVPAGADHLLIRIGASILRLYKDGHGVLTLPAGHRIEAPLTTITGDVIINGNLQVDKNVKVSGRVDVVGDVVAGGISLINHLTTGVQSGDKLSGPPQ
jgi:hypothetical protein